MLTNSASLSSALLDPKKFRLKGKMHCKWRFPGCTLHYCKVLEGVVHSNFVHQFLDIDPSRA